MRTIIVPPKRQRGELLFLLIATLLILSIAALLILMSSQESSQKKVKSYQINALEKLGPNDLNIFTNLYSSASEIEQLHFTNGERWPEIRSLENELIPPFAKDALWEKRGKLTWTLFPADRDEVHRASYIGKTSNNEIASSFIIIFEHFHTLDGAYYIGVNIEKAYSIWVKPGQIVVPSDFSQGALIKDGWYQVIIYTGSDEIKNLQGEK